MIIIINLLSYSKDRIFCFVQRKSSDSIRNKYILKISDKLRKRYSYLLYHEQCSTEKHRIFNMDTLKITLFVHLPPVLSISKDLYSNPCEVNLNFRFEQ